METRLEDRYSGLAWMLCMNTVRAVHWTVASVTGSGKATHDLMESRALVQNPNSTDVQVRISCLVPTAYLPPTAQNHTAFTAFTHTIVERPMDVDLRWGVSNRIGGYSD